MLIWSLKEDTAKLNFWLGQSLDPECASRVKVGSSTKRIHNSLTSLYNIGIMSDSDKYSSNSSLEGPVSGPQVCWPKLLVDPMRKFRSLSEFIHDIFSHNIVNSFSYSLHQHISCNA